MALILAAFRAAARKWPLALLFLALTGCGPQIQKAAWVVRYNVATPESIERICNEARAGFDSLVVQVRGRGDAYYRSAVAPRTERLDSQPIHFDPLQETLAACSPVPIHAWLNVYYLWGGENPPADPRHPAQRHREWIIRDADGRSVADYSPLDKGLGWIEGIYADPASSAYRELFSQVVEELVHNYPVAGIHLDFVRYPGAAYGHGGELAQLFRERWGLDPRWLPTSLNRAALESWLAGTMAPADRVLTTAALLWAEMRAEQITELVRAVRTKLDRSGRPLELSAAIFPEAGDAYLTKGQDWQTWAAEGLLDALYPMAYFGGPERVSGLLEEIAGRWAAGPKLWAGLGSYLKEPAAIAREAEQARKLGYHGICLFDMDHLLQGAEGSRPYLQAVGGPRTGPPKPARFCLPLDQPNFGPGLEPESLGRIVAKGLGGQLEVDDRLAPLLASRWAEFTAARLQFEPIISRLAAAEQPTPPWVEMQGIFRYLHPLDSPRKKQEQLAKSKEARQRLLAGEDFAAVAVELSQGGSKKLGGRLKRRYLDPQNPVDQLLAALQPGQLSPVVEVDNGFWCYRIIETYPAGLVALTDLDWPVRRKLFRNELVQILAAQPQP